MFQFRPGILSRSAIDAAGVPAGPTDPGFANVQLLVSFDGADAATSTTDFSSIARTMTFVGNAQLDTAQSKFGGASLLLDGTGDSVTTPFGAGFQFSGPFTIEGWIRFASLANGNYTIVSAWAGAAANSFRAWMNKGSATRSLNFSLSTDGTNAAFTTTSPTLQTTLLDAAQHHVAFDRDTANKMRIYLNGVMTISTASATGTNFNTATPLSLGGASSGHLAWIGHQDEWRITKGTSRYGDTSGDTTFTPPSAAFARS